MKMSRRTAIRTLVATGVGGLAGAGAYRVVYTPDPVQLSNVTVPVVGLPPGLTGLRIGLMTDVHRSRWVSSEAVATAVALLQSAQPDLIVLGGDYVTWGDTQYVGPSAEDLGRLTAPHGVFAILGNHDGDRDMPAALTAQGISVLKDARTRLTIKHESLELAGIRFWTRRGAELAKVLRGATGTVVLLAHDPRRLTEAIELQVPLVLSGHTHGGQVVLPGVGAVAARKFPVVAGLARRDATTLYVSRGVGTVYVPVRINCPPEVAILTLESASSPV
jgi:predicted MPP superfamily phosphohydrolase